MNTMTMNYQKMVKLANGGEIPIGQDGIPYADDGILIVADGLGGRGGFPHKIINPDVFDREQFYDTFIGSVLDAGALADDKYKEFVTASFNELFELKDIYFENIRNMRESGWFASRIVTAIALYAFKFHPDFKKEIIFENIAQKETADAPNEYINSLRKTLKTYILDGMGRVAEKMGLQLESKWIGAYLLPTTLAVSLMNETDIGVDVLYLWAGDSRGYAWTRQEGLMQVTKDHEIDEAMTNLISLSIKDNAYLEAKCLHFGKPVVLFNSTDGCYKCPIFYSPFDFEYDLLEGASKSNSYDDFANWLKAYFKQNGTHDDSNTIAWHSFGYDDFSALKDAMQERHKAMEEEMKSQGVADLFAVNPKDELTKINAEIIKANLLLKEELIQSDGIKAGVLNLLKEANDPKYVAHESHRIDEMKKLDDERKNVLEYITEFVRSHWLELRKQVLDSPSPKADKLYKKIVDAQKEIKEQKPSFVSEWQAILTNLYNVVASLKNIDSEDILTAPLSDDLKNNVESAGLFAKALENIISPKAKRKKSNGKKDIVISLLLDGLAKDKKELLEKEKDAIEQFANDLFNGNKLIDAGLKQAIVNDKEVNDLAKQIEEYNAKQKEFANKQKEFDANLEAIKLEYWDKNHERFIKDIQGGKIIVSDDIKTKISDNLTKLQDRKTANEEKLKQFEKFYVGYNKGYLTYIGEE